ncbi:MAG: YbaB/EbfC family nucleoid-associated protein [Dehalococcoidia bacterium]
MAASDPAALESALGPLGEMLAAARRRLAATEVEATAGGGMVLVTMDGERRLRSITIDPAAMDAEPAELADLILAAANEAFDKANAAKSSAIEGLVPGADGLR